MKYIVTAAILAGIAFPAIAGPDRKIASNPLENFCFQVEVDGLAVGTFREVKGLNENADLVEVQDGDDKMLRKRPGRSKFGDVTLQRGAYAHGELEAWWQAAREGTYDRRSLDVRLIDDCEPPSTYIDFPTTWTVSGTFDKASSKMLMEELTLNVENIEFKKP